MAEHCVHMRNQFPFLAWFLGGDFSKQVKELSDGQKTAAGVVKTSAGKSQRDWDRFNFKPYVSSSAESHFRAAGWSRSSQSEQPFLGQGRRTLPLTHMGDTIWKKKTSSIHL